MTATEFSQLVKQTLAAGIDARTIAGAFGCTKTTVERWAAGTSRPSPNVMGFVAKRLTELRDKAKL